MIIRVVVCAALLSLAARAQSHEEKERNEREEKAPREHGEARVGDDDLLYALGAMLGHRVQDYGFSSRELARIERGFADAAAKRPLKLKEPDLEELGPRVDAMLQRRGNPRIAAEKQRASTLLAAEAREPGAVLLPEGAVLRVLHPGQGENPKHGDRVHVKYEARTADGKVFDSSPGADVPLDGVVRCWSLGVPKMKVGGKARLACPSALAYGDQGRPPQVPGGAAVIFDIELLSIVR
ncbi:MAG TPA: FKBP-type peptidyl-prolyl cis-trans isomerase [Myxococcales bacterium]|nr:FKBP-type peptidyl-prolyl cis-trans isomerase [Myxococcales bacterium]